MINILGLTFHGYGLMIAIGILVAWEIAIKWGKSDKKEIEDLAVGLIASGVVGGRIYHVIDLWSYYSKDMIKILYLWNGGMGIWGAVIGGLVYLWIYSHLKRKSFWSLSDSITLGLPVAQAVGRVGNYINKELYGKNGEPLFAWEGILNLILFLVLFFVNKKNKKPGLVSGLYLVGYGVIRIFLENFRPDNIIWRIGGVPTAIWVSGLAIICGGIVALRAKEK